MSGSGSSMPRTAHKTASNAAISASSMPRAFAFSITSSRWVSASSIGTPVPNSFIQHSTTNLIQEQGPQ